MDILNLPEHIRILEELLLHQDFSGSPEALEAMLDADFREVNPDGKIVSRESVVRWLLGKDPSMRWEFTNFEASLLAPGLAMATYRARQMIPGKPASEGAMHSSLWRMDSASEWQLVFHQSTRISK